MAWVYFVFKAEVLEMADFGSKEAGKKGGKARAIKLSSEERKEIARSAARARWGTKADPVRVATHEGEMSFAGVMIPCAVLEDGTRVLSERGVTKGFGLKRAGSNWQKKDESGARMPVFASANNIKPFIDKDLEVALKSPILFASQASKGNVAHGVEAELIPRVCEVWLRARDAGVIKPQQIHIVAQADLIMRGLARVGIAALVDEATGFQDDRDRRALSLILEKFISKELRKWVKTFPLDYYKELCRLRGIPFSASMKLPQYFGHLTNNLIYSRLAPGVLQELRDRNPVEDGRRKHKHFQHLTNDIGHPKLLQHLGSVVTLMKISQSWEDLESLVNKLHPVYKEMPLLDRVENLEDYRG